LGGKEAVLIANNLGESMELSHEEESGLRRALLKEFIPLGRAGTRKSLRELRVSALLRAETLRKSAGDYADFLIDNPGEVLSLWDAKAASFPGERGFFTNPSVYEAALELIREWAVFSSLKSLRVLVLDSGPGYQAVSLSILLSGLSLKAGGWDISIIGLDLSASNVKKSKELLFEEREVKNIPFSIRKWFKYGGGYLRFQEKLGLPLSFAFGDPYLSLDDPDNRVSDFLDGADVLFARNLTQEADDSKCELIPELSSRLLREGGLMFTSPGELWIPPRDMSLELRDGVFYYRKGSLKLKRNRFFRPKRVKGNGPFGDADAKGINFVNGYLDKAKAFRDKNDEDQAMEAAIEALTLAQETGVASREAFELLANLEKERGRYKVGERILKATELLEGFL
jgi:chemotaxis methyl-accepting protein methylase